MKDHFLDDCPECGQGTKAGMSSRSGNEGLSRFTCHACNITWSQEWTIEDPTPNKFLDEVEI